MAYQGGYGGGYPGGPGGPPGGYNGGYGSGHPGGYQQPPPHQPPYGQYPPPGGPPGGPPPQGHNQYPPQHGGPPPPSQGYNRYPPQGGPPPQHGYGQYPPQGGPPPQPGYNQHPPGGSPPPHGYNQPPQHGGPPPQHGYNQYPPHGGPPPPQQGYNHGGPPPQPGYNHGGPPPQHGYNHGGPTPPQGYPQHPPQGGHPPQPNYSQHPGPGGAPPIPPRPNGYGPPSQPPHPSQPSPAPYGYPGSGGPVGHRPPTAPQQFGHGAPEGYTFQYSNCTGRRKALLIGINYFGQENALGGCINDTKNLSAFLIERYNYKREDMIILTDDQTNPILIPTKANIIRALGWLVKDARPNDALFLHYSGHGGQTADLDGDEEDGYDEVIYPVDYKQVGHIVDDTLHQIVVKPLVAGVRLTAIFDSCHSGSVLDIPYIYSTKGMLKEPNLAAEAGQGLLRAISAYAMGNKGGAASAIMGIARSAVKGESAYKKAMQTKTSPADVIMWSGSRDDQTSADATIASMASGAMSYAFITALKKNPNQSYVQLLNSIRDILEAKYSQKPQLSCSHPLDTNLLFVM